MPELEQLSEREIEILRLLANGATNKDIARQLVISINTVKAHLKSIYAKLEVASRTEATLVAVRSGLVVVEPSVVPGETLETDDRPAAERPSGLLAQLRTLPVWLPVAVVIVVLALLFLATWALWPRPDQPFSASGNPLELENTDLRWQQRVSMATPRSRFALSVFDNRLYAIAGEALNGPSSAVEVYDPDLDGWQLLAEKPLAVADVSAAVIGGALFVPGGRLPDGSISDRLDVYHPDRDEWESRAGLPAGRSAYALVPFEGRLFLFGGWDGQQYVDTVFEYDPVQDRWQELAPMPTRRGFAGAVVQGGRIHVIGGWDGQQALVVHETFMPGAAAGAWGTAEPLPEGRYGMGLANLAETIYLVGGLDGDASTQVSFQYLPSQNQWVAIDNLLAQTWAHMGLVPLGANLFILGGELNGVPTDQFWSYQAIYTIALPVIQQ
ncbi:MAG: hypothetical protein JW862_16240 [Anaerolineales bacterium]|nr:hypothetical protein [Anaerolineales bacterium]